MTDNSAAQEARLKAEELYRSGRFLYSEADCTVANEYQGHPMPVEAVRLASGFPVGIGLAGCTCGALSGGVMALGLKYGRSTPGVPAPGMFEASKELHDRFKARRKRVCCRSLIRPFEFGSADHLAQCIANNGRGGGGRHRIAGERAKA